MEEQKNLLATFPQVIVGSASAVREDIVLRRAGAISGHVTVDSGGALSSAAVTATMVSSSLIGNAAGGDGKKSANFSLSSTTDDRGLYRIAGLPHGKYRIGVRLAESHFEAGDMAGVRFTIRPTRTGIADLTVFAPEALSETDAKLVEIGDGDELSDVDVTIPMRLLHSIGGTVTQSGAPLAQAWLTVQRGGQKVQLHSAISTSDGSYRFDLLPPGSYTIEARYPFQAESSGPSASRKIVILLHDTDVMDANLDVPTLARAK